MHMLARWRLELFLAALAAVELATVANTHVARKPAALVITALSVGVLFGRRWQPLAATVAAFAALTASVAVMPRSTTAQFFGTLATFAIAGAVNREREATVAWIAGAGMLAYAAWVDPFGSGAADFGLSLAFCTAMWGAGLLVARRGRHATQAREEAAAVARDSEMRTRNALAEERAAIARELHDVVSHGLSVVVVQTLAARSVLSDISEPEAEEVDRHLDAVESSARDALAEMRRMLGLLQNTEDAVSNGTSGAVTPAPGLAHLGDLVTRVTGGRGHVQLNVAEQLGLPAGVELAAYRITQEALTNVVKHAPGAAVAVVVEQRQHQVTVSVTNGPSPAPGIDPPIGAGRGLIGARERAALYGGTVDAAPTGDGGYRLVATLPTSTDPSTPPTWPAARSVESAARTS